MGFFNKISKGLEKTRKGLSGMLEDLFTDYTQIDDELFEELEYILVASDVSVTTAHQFIEKLKQKILEDHISSVRKVHGAFQEVIAVELKKNEAPVTDPNKMTVIVVIGVNGVGKTTTIGKLAHHYQREGKKVMIAAGDTFRAAAIDQVKVWGERSNTPVIHQKEGSDPASVIYDSLQSAKAKQVDYLICDTAGRLHNKVNLMNELQKIFKIIDREAPEAQREAWLVLDATTGQNAINQAKVFNETAALTGLVLTKLDGTAKGGVVLSIHDELGVPIKFVGVGETIDDLEPFDAMAFAKGLFLDS